MFNPQQIAAVHQGCENLGRASAWPEPSGRGSLNIVKLIHLPRITDNKSLMIFYSHNNVLPFKVKNSFFKTWSACFN